MVTVADVLALPVFDNVNLAAPCEGFEGREVINCGTLDYEPFFHDYHAFVPGEFIFTTLGFAQMHPELAEEALLALIEHGVAAIAIKPVALKSLTAAVREASARAQVPVFFYDGRYMERVIASVMTLIDEEAVNTERNRLIDQVLAPSDERHVANLIFSISGMTGATVQCMAIQPLVMENATLRALHGVVRNVIEDYGRRFDEVGGTFTCVYDDMILAFVSFKRPPQSVITISEADLAATMSQAGPLLCGISQELPMGEGDLAIRQAQASLATARLDDSNIVRWTALRFDAFLAAAGADRLFSRTAALIMDLLKEYDTAHDAELAPTALAYARALGEVRTAADALFQHPNTVRYRLRKIKEVLGMGDATDRELAVILTFAALATDNKFRDSFDSYQTP
ncbi:MAG: PucR family transcriptional regulator [Eggerthellaceae bacterium]|nr:PucR family transcriptional regulator [Eggerthellaceae bacterium]